MPCSTKDCQHAGPAHQTMVGELPDGTKKTTEFCKECWEDFQSKLREKLHAIKFRGKLPTTR